jgi:hypothetical protein
VRTGPGGGCAVQPSRSRSWHTWTVAAHFLNIVLNIYFQMKGAGTQILPGHKRL